MRLPRRRWPAGAAASAIVLVLGVSSLASAAPHVPGPSLPNHHLTPGAHFAAGQAAICEPGYSERVRDVPESEKDEAYARYGLARVPDGYEVDHLVSLEIGGSNAITNLWPEHYYEPWGARTKDRLEDKLHELVCSGRLSLASAQEQEAADWITAYRRYVGAASANGSTAGPAASPRKTAAARPAKATAKCRDGTYSFAKHHQGACSHHGGVALFYT